MGKWKYVPIRESLVHRIDKAVERGIYSSRSNFVEDAVRRRLEELGLLDPRGE